MIDEIWKDVSEFPSLFMVSNHGRVWSKRSNRILVPSKLKNGYLAISSKIGGRKGRNICKRVHRWVAEAFIPNPEEKPYVNHIDGDKENNIEDNLEWCTAKENSKHAYETGLACSKKGEEVSRSKLKNSDIRKIRELRGKMTQRELGEMFGVSHSTIGEIQLKKAWRHID